MNHMPPILVERTIAADRSNADLRRVRSVTVNLAESPLSWLHARGGVNARQFAAGALLHADYIRAGLSPRVTMQWDDLPRGRHGGSSDTHQTGRIDAHSRFHAAMAEAGPGLRDVLWRVVCAEERLPHVEAALRWPRRAGKLVLTLALDRIADYYKVP
jgi:hypothetical protein